MKREIHLPEALSFDVRDFRAYPPRLMIYVQSTTAPNLSDPEVQVIGLDVECSFQLPVVGKT